MDYKKLKRIWQREEQMSFKGWDFSYLENRWESDMLPWDYSDIVKEYLKPHLKLLDIGTGGGEFLLTLCHPYANTSVTESYEPNVNLCMERLKPLGIDVRQVYEDNRMPFKDNSFDIVINRHASFDIKEIKRILRADGVFVTQQVGGKNNEMLSNKLIKKYESPYKKFTLENTSKQFEENDFELIYENEYYPSLRFYDIGAVVYFAKIIQWEFPGFTVETNFNELCELQDELIKKGYIESFEHRFIVVAKLKN